MSETKFNRMISGQQATRVQEETPLLKVLTTDAASGFSRRYEKDRLKLFLCCIGFV